MSGRRILVEKMPETASVIPWEEIDTVEVNGQSLAAAVVAQAVNDALAPVYLGHGDPVERAKPKDKADAIAFCIATEGDWAAERVRWCDAAGVLPDAVREYVLGRMNLDMLAEAGTNGNDVEAA